MQSTRLNFIGTVISALMIACAIAVLQFVHWSPGQFGMGSGYDSGIFAYCGHVLAETSELYRFCTDNKPPGIFIINALASLGTSNGTDWRSVWLLAWGAQVLAWTTVGWLASRSDSSQDGWLVAAVGAVSTFLVLDGAATVEMFSLPFQVTIACCVFVLVRRRDRHVGLLAAIGGAAVGALFLLRPNNVAATMLLVGVWMLCLTRREWGNAVRIALCSSTAAVVVIALAIYLTGGRESVDGTMEFALSQGVSYSGAQRASRLVAAASNLAWGSSLLALFGTVMWIATPVSARQPERPRARLVRTLVDEPWMVLLAIWFLFEVVFSSVSARRFPHYAQMLLVPLALLVAEVLRVRRGESDRRLLHLQRGWQQAVRVAAVLLASTLVVLPTVRLQAGSTSEVRAIRAYARTLADTLAGRGAAAGGVYMWGGPPAVYVALNNAAPVRHLAPSTLATPGFSTPEYFSETISCLAGSAPQFVLDAFDGSTVGFHRGPATVPTMSELPEFTALREFVARNYEYLGPIPGTGTALWKRSASVTFLRDSAGVAAKDCRPHQGSWRLHAP